MDPKVLNFDKWLKLFDKSWEEGNSKDAANLFTENVIYYENPLEQPLRSRKEIEKVWSEVPKTQKDIKVKSEVYMTSGNTCVAHFKASFFKLTSNKISTLDGIYIFNLNIKGLCEEFHFWWVEKDS